MMMETPWGLLGMAFLLGVVAAARAAPLPDASRPETSRSQRSERIAPERDGAAGFAPKDAMRGGADSGARTWPEAAIPERGGER